MKTAKSPGAVAAHGALEIDQLERQVISENSLRQNHAQDTFCAEAVSWTDAAAMSRLAKLQLAYFKPRCRWLAEQVRAGFVPFIWAVDCAYDAAIHSGLADSVGDDAVQGVMAEAFMGLQRKVGP